MMVNKGVSGIGCKTQSLVTVVETSKAQCTALTASIHIHLRIEVNITLAPLLGGGLCSLLGGGCIPFDIILKCDGRQLVTFLLTC